MESSALKVEVSIKADGLIKALNELNQSIEQLMEKLKNLREATVMVNSCEVKSGVDVDAIIKKISESLEQEIKATSVNGVY